jgi:hypothetical protein
MSQLTQSQQMSGFGTGGNLHRLSHTQPVGGHLTTRGRRLVALLALVPLVAAMVLTGSHQASATGTSPTSRQIVVHAGESLWDIAVRVAPNEDPRKTMWDIQKLNNMTTSRLDSGQALRVPVQ